MFGLIVQAKSTVYLFVNSIGDPESFEILANGKQVANLKPSIKKIIKYNIVKLKRPLGLTNPCCQKIVFTKEGKLVLGADVHYINPLNLENLQFKGETQIDLVDGESYYFLITDNGLDDMRFKDVKPKKAMKDIEKNKFEMLPEVTVE